MEERDLVFRERLIALMTALRTEMQNPVLRRRIGAVAIDLARQAGVRNWADLKQRADGPTHDSLLKLFMKLGEDAARLKDDKSLRTFEALALSLIARSQKQDDLVAGVNLLDGFIADCETLVRRLGVTTLPIRTPTRQ